MKYAVIVEEGDTSFGAHVPDFPLNLVREFAAAVLEHLLQFLVAARFRRRCPRALRRHVRNRSFHLSPDGGNSASQSIMQR